MAQQEHEARRCIDQLLEQAGWVVCELDRADRDIVAVNQSPIIHTSCNSAGVDINSESGRARGASR